MLRAKKAVTQEQLALQVNKGTTTISNWEKGVSEPNLSEIGILTNYLGVSADELLFVDLSKGNLIEKEGSEKTRQNSNLNSNGIGNLTPKKGAKAPYLRDETEPETHVLNDDSKPYGPVLMPRVVTADTNGEENSVFVPVKARAGYLLGYGDAEFIGTLPAYKIIGNRNRSYRIFEVDGNSMFNTLNDKDTVNAYWVRLTDVRDGRIYVIVTRNDGILIKRVINRYKEGLLICKSDNNHKGDYPPIVLNIHDIVECWYVESATTHNLAPPGEIYDRMLQLEASVAILMHKIDGQNKP